MTKIIILAAGKGKRMGCVDTPKVMLPFLGKPIIHYGVEAVKKSGVDNKPILVVGFCGQKVKDYFGDTCLYAEQTEQKGTGHAVLCAQKIAGGAENILVLNGDHPLIQAETICKLTTAHEKGGADLTFFAVDVPSFDGWYEVFDGYGRIIRNENGDILKVIETKDAAPEERKKTEVNVNLYCFKASWLWTHLPLLKNKNAQGEYYITDLVDLATAEGIKINSAFAPPEECLGINTPEQLQLAEEIYKKMSS